MGPKLNLKKLSAADERRIEAALELAGTFSRLGTSDHCPPSTPRTPGAASRESKESLASNNSNNSDSSPTSSHSHFRFNFSSKARKEDRKSSADDHRLSSRLTDPDSLLTAEALEAYDRLVSKGGGTPGELLSSAKRRDRLLPKQTTLGGSSGGRTVLGRHRYRMSNSHSESDKDGVPVAGEEGVPAKTGTDGTPKRTGRGRRRRHRTLTESNPFSWFDRNPLNTAKSEQQNGRPNSFHFEAGCVGGGGGLSPFPLSMPSLNPGIQLPPRAGRATKNSESTTRRPPPPPPPASEDSDTPPAIPPRIPHRHPSTTTRSKFHPRNHQMTGAKPRSYSDSDHTVSATAQSMRGSPSSRLYAPSRLTAEAGDSSDPSPSPVHRSLDGSYDCVFFCGPRSPLPPPPLVREPLVPREPPVPGGSARGEPKGFGIAPCRSTSVKDVKVKELRTTNKNDPSFREKKSGAPELSECHSETDLLREAHTPIPGCYETSDSISYEDLMEFALDGPRYEDR